MTTEKTTKLTITLTEEQVSILKVQAAKAAITDWKLHAKNEFETNVLNALIGTPRIGAGPKITAPSTNAHYNHLNT